jgi:diguanylate cyclase (GGDEF)-like protein
MAALASCAFLWSDSQVGGMLDRPLLTGAVFAALILSCAALCIEGMVMRPLRRLSRAMRRAADGDFLVRVRADGRKDEIGNLADSFNRLLAKITALKADEVDVQRDLAEAHQQLKLQEAFEEANALLERRLNALSLLYEVARSFTSTLELPELLARISAQVAERLEIPQFSIMLLNSDGQLEVKTAYPPGRGTEGIRFQSHEGACGRAAETHSAVYIADVSSDRIFVARRPERERGSLLCVPMIHQEEILGVLNFQRPQRDAFTSEEIEVLSAVADQAALAVKNARLHEETVALAITDPLTGIPNRRHLFSQLEMEVARANRFGNQVSTLMLDIDHFKSFNDAAGHQAGDAVLRQVAALMKGMIRKVDTIGRYGGEEFLLILPLVTKVEAVEVAEKLRRAVEATVFEPPRNGHRITVSVGVANLPVDATTQEKLVDCADAALYASKRAGRNRVMAYTAGMELHPGRERLAGVRRAVLSSAT